MAQLLRITGSAKYYAHYYNFREFSHGMWSTTVENQNPNDFGYIYYVQNGSKNLVGTCIYEFDYYCFYNDGGSSSKYLCDDRGNQYTFGTGATYKSYNNSGSYRSIDSEKLIHGNNLNTLSLNPTSNTIYNNRGNWYAHNITSSIGGGFNITYYPSSHDNVYVYLTNGPLKTSYFTLYDMTNPDVLAGNATGNISGALYSNILHAYDMGDCYSYLNNDGSINISIIFNNIGKNSTSNEYSIFYGTKTWIYIYSSTGNFRRKKALVQKYNDDYPTTPYEVIYTFDHNDDNIGYNIIGFPLFEWRSTTGAKGYLINYYNILISDYDVSRAMVTINFDEVTSNYWDISLNGNICNSGDIYYYTLGTTLNFVATQRGEGASNKGWTNYWAVNGEQLTINNTLTTTLSLSINNNMTYNVTTIFNYTETVKPHPNPGLG